MAMLFGGHRDMTREELLARLASLRQARVGQIRVPHKPLLLLWLFGHFAATGKQRSHLPAGGRARQPADQRFRPTSGQRGRSPTVGGHAVRAPGT